MQDIHGFPYGEIEFTKHGEIHRSEQLDELLHMVEQREITDLFVIAHGWNNDMDDARALYQSFFRRVRNEVDSRRITTEGRTFGVLGVLWPSKRFAEKELIPSGAAAAESPVTETVLEEQLEDLKGTFDDPEADVLLEQAKGMVPKLEDSPVAQKEFVDLLRRVVPTDATEDEDASEEFLGLPGEEVIDRLSRPVMPAPPGPAAGGATGGVAGVTMDEAAGGPGGAAGIGQWFSGVRSGARNFLNFLTYYQMKARAGKVGAGGVYQVLRAVRARNEGVKLHLVGHSFGARLVTAAALGPPGQPPVKPSTLSLLQAAFSHYGFADAYDGTRDGFFRSVISKKLVAGPIVISHTKNDRAVGLAYPLASLLAGQDAAALGDENDRFGGLGRNGAQKTPEAQRGSLLDVDGTYEFEAGKTYNLNADAYILNHSDISKDQVAHALISAVSKS
jgi:hypothetical protein